MGGRAGVALCLVTAGCVSLGVGNPGSSPESVPASAGTYRIHGTVEYRQDTSEEAVTAKEAYQAVLEVTPDGVISVHDDLGPCPDVAGRTPDEERRLEGTVFHCTRADFAIVSTGGKLRGEVAVQVTESVRINTGCVRYHVTSHQRRTTTCVEYQWRVNSGRTQVRAPLRLERIEEGGGEGEGVRPTPPAP